MSRIRQNIVTGEWVVVSPERQKRPQEFAHRPFASSPLHDQSCNFCVGGPAWESRIREASTAHVYVVANKYPAMAEAVAIEETGHNFYSDAASIGIHEVVALTDARDTLPSMQAHRLFDLLSTLQHRARDYESHASVESIMPIYNHGHDAGASVAHPHAQLFGNALIPPRLGREFFGASQYHNKHRSCVFCEMTKFELQQHERIIYKNADMVAFAAYAPRFPFEIHLVPLRHQPAFAAASSDTVKGAAEALHAVLQRLNHKLHDPALNWFIHSGRKIDHHLQSSYHWHIEIAPRLGTFGGYELGSDMIIETVLPEIAAEFLR